MQSHFLAIGELLADVITTDYCESLSDAKSFEIFQGGSPGNVAANLKWLGKNAELVACVGDDGIGQFLISEIQRIGISGDYIQVSQEFPTSLVMVTRSKGTPDFIAYRAADTQLQPIANFLLETASVVHSTAFALSKSPAREVILSAFKKAKSLHKTISVDWNFAPSIWGPDDGKEVFETVARLEPYMKLSLDDMERFFSKSSPVEEYKTMLQQYPFTFICLTCGKEGVWYKEKNKGWKFRVAKKVEQVVDTTGAGDAFWAGFMAAHINQQAGEECIGFALEIAAQKIQKLGPLYLT